MYLELKQSDINKLILQYLKNNDFPFTYFTFSKETQDDNFQYLNHKLEDIILKGLTYLYLESHDQLCDIKYNIIDPHNCI